MRYTGLSKKHEFAHPCTELLAFCRNPFVNNWSTSATVTLSLGFVFGLAVFALMYQTYLSVLIFRILCDVAVR